VLPPTGVGGAGTTPKNELVGQIEAGVVLDRQIVGAVAASRPIADVVSRAATPHSSVNLRRLEQRLLVSVGVVVGRALRRQLNEEEQLVEDVKTPPTDVTTRVTAHITKYRLNRVTIGVTFNIAD